MCFSLLVGRFLQPLKTRLLQASLVSSTLVPLSLVRQNTCCSFVCLVDLLVCVFLSVSASSLIHLGP
eukprot:m.616682 g.616682  ORF g.616682 m.616682 type:complete len:67 (+) comp58168_c3_seq19:2357-2557(+)